MRVKVKISNFWKFFCQLSIGTTVAYTCRIEQNAPWRVASWWPLPVTRWVSQNGWAPRAVILKTERSAPRVSAYKISSFRSHQNDDQYETYSASRPVFMPVVRSPNVPSDFLKTSFKYHQNDISKRAVFIKTCREAHRFALPLISQNCAPKSELLELSSKYQVKSHNTARA